MDDGVIIIDEHLNITFVNSEIEELSGYSKKELIEMNILELIDAEELFKVMDEQEDRKKGIRNAYQLIANNKLGQQILVNVYSQPIVKKEQYLGSIIKISLPK